MMKTTAPILLKEGENKKKTEVEIVKLDDRSDDSPVVAMVLQN